MQPKTKVKLDSDSFNRIKKKAIITNHTYKSSLSDAKSNYKSILKLFTEELDHRLISHISVELQLFLTNHKIKEHEQFLKKEFGIINNNSANGLLRDISNFQHIDIHYLIHELQVLRKFCEEKNITLIGYPNIIEYDNIKSFYSGQWNRMIEKKDCCMFPWFYLEVSASGNVTPCHTFYDFVVGNVHEDDIMDIWKNEKFMEFRKKLKKTVMPICCACSRYYY